MTIVNESGPGGDAPNTIATTNTISVGDQFNGSLQSVGDQDWIRLSLTQGDVVDISMVGGSLSDTYLEVYDASGNNRLAFNDDATNATLNSTIVYTATYTGDVFINARAYNNAGAGTYSVDVSTTAPIFTNDQIADYLENGYWQDTGRSARSFSSSTITVDITELSADAQQLATWALESWSNVANLNFVFQDADVVGGGNIDISFSDTGAGNSASNSSSTSGSTIISSSVNVTQGWLSTYGTTVDSYSFQTYIHEIGHALGLGHGGYYNGSATYTTQPGGGLGSNQYLNDSWQASVMSYMSQNDNLWLDATYAFVTTAQVADILAIQALYGASSVRTSDTIYGVGSTAGGYLDQLATLSNPITFTIHDDGGIDTINLGSVTVSQMVDLNAEAISNVAGSTGNMIISRGTIIENLISGSGSDVIIGNAADNTITGGGGSDTIDGGAGTDTVVLAGNQASYTLSTVGAVTSLSLGAITVALTAVELVQFADSLLILGAVGDVWTGTAADEIRTGTADNDTLDGAGGVDTINGQGGLDTLNGGSGQDHLIGGLGNDILNGGAGGDRLTGGAAGQSAFQAPGTSTYMADVTGNGALDLIEISLGGRIEVMKLAAGSLAAPVASGLSSEVGNMIVFGDFFGNGQDEMLAYDTDGTTSALYSFSADTFTETAWTQGDGASYVAVRVGDFDGDGVDETLNLTTGNLTNYSAGSSPTTTNWSTGFTTNDRVADFNGDDKDDIYQYYNGNSYIYLANAAGDGFENYTLWGTGVQAFDQFGDFNGDGKTDVLQFYNGRGYIYLANDEGTGFEDYTLWGTGFTQADRVADFNGDGATDVIQFYAGNVYVYLSNGVNGFDAYTLWGTGLQADDIIADFTGDGAADVMQRYDGRAYLYESGIGATEFLPYRVIGTGPNGGQSEGDDRFVFDEVNIGHDVITDFDAGAGVGDIIQLSRAGFSSLADILAVASNDAAGNAVIAFDAQNSISLTGVSVETLVEDDFAFVSV